MTRFFAIAHYLTAGGNHGSTSFPVLAADMDDALQRARAKVNTRGRRKIVVHIY